MKINLALFNAERTWRGLTMIDGEMFKVTLFPGSATQPWEAELRVASFIELDEEKPLYKAIEKEFNHYINLSHGLTQDENDKMVELIESNPEMMREIQEVLEKKGGDIE